MSFFSGAVCDGWGLGKSGWGVVWAVEWAGGQCGGGSRGCCLALLPDGDDSPHPTASVEVDHVGPRSPTTSQPIIWPQGISPWSITSRNTCHPLGRFPRWFQQAAAAERLLSSVLRPPAALAAPGPPLEAGEPAERCDCVAFQGIHSVSFMSVISVRNREPFPRLIHIIDKMRN